MTEISNLTGTPWHTEMLHAKEGDPHRHPAKCVHYLKAQKECSKLKCACKSAAHCEYYVADGSKEDAQHQSHKGNQGTRSVPFSGLKYIPLAEVQADETKFKTPSAQKVDELMAYYAEYKELDKPIVVSCVKGRYILHDKYLRYYVAQKLGLKMIPAIMKNATYRKISDVLRQKGTRVIHKTFGKGTIIDATLENIEILFDTGESSVFKIYVCIENNVLVVLQDCKKILNLSEK